MKKQFRDFKFAREFAKSLNLKSQKEWQKYCKSGNKPDDIPSIPNRTYKNKGWTGYGDWLGTKSIATKDMEYRSFNDARKFVRKLKFQRQSEWMEYCKSGNKPDDIPRNPQRTYKKEWEGMGNFLGTNRIATQDMVYRPYKKAHKFVQQLNLKSGKEWTDYCKSGNKPDDIPYDAKKVYKKEWKDMGDWLGTKIVATYNRKYLSAKEAKPVLKKLFKEYRIKNLKDWSKFAKTHAKLLDELNLPSAILHTYSIGNVNRKSKK